MAITGEVVGIGKRPDRNSMIIYVQFKNDGVEIPQNNVFDGKQVWFLHCQYMNFAKRTLAEVQDWVRINVQNQCDTYIKLLASEPLNNTMIAGDLGKLVGDIHSKASAEVEYFPGVIVTVYPDGTIA